MREKARLEPRYAELVYDGLWFSPLKEALDAFMGHAPGVRHRRGAPAPRARPVLRGRSPRRPRPLQLRPRHLRRGRHASATRTPPASCASGASRWRRGRASRAARARCPARDPLARPLRRRSGRRAPRVHREPVVRPAARARRHRGLARARRRCSRASGCSPTTRATQVLAALDRVEGELAEGTFEFAPTDEDIHTAIERRVTELAGDAGAKLHTGRSRNDQVATALRLFVRREGTDVARARPPAAGGAARRARDGAGDVYLPGYTHLQRAQPVLLAHHFLAHFWAFARDVDRWRDALGAGRRVAARRRRARGLEPAARSRRHRRRPRLRPPLRQLARRGVGPRLRGRGAVRRRAHARCTSRASARRSCCGRARSSASCASPTRTAPARRCCRRRRTPTSPSSRGARPGGSSATSPGFLATLKGLPLAYNRDLQEDKEPLFDALDQCRLALRRDRRAARDRRGRAGADAGRGRRAARRRRRPRRVAGAAGRAVPRRARPRRARWCAQSAERGVPLDELVLTDPDLGPEALALLEPGAAVLRRTTPGGAGPGVGRGAAR